MVMNMTEYVNKKELEKSLLTLRFNAWQIDEHYALGITAVLEILRNIKTIEVGDEHDNG